VSGIQTAVVVGPKGEEIYTDKYGRVKVQFHWDREGKKDESSSCWIRVAHNMAGRRWGFLSIPRIGQEVVVDFLEGDPDRPLIVGSVYNADQMPHYELPANKTRSYIKSNSSKGGDGFNELHFEDQAGKERVFLHAQHDMDVRVRNDSKERIYGHRHQIIGWEKDGKKGGDQREKVWQDKHLKVKRHQAEHIEGNYALMVGNGEAESGGKVDVVVEKQALMKIGQEGLNVKIDGDVKQKIGGVQSVTVDGGRKEKLASLSVDVAAEHNEKNGGHSLTVGKDQHVKVSMNHALEAGKDIHIKAGMNLVIEAGMQLTLKVGGNFVSITPAGVDIQGILVNINSGGSAGSGSGAKPVSPEAPDEPDEAEEAQPTEPAQAHSEKTGAKSC
jgi:type VI secretion system secreted protein VgrG